MSSFDWVVCPLCKGILDESPDLLACKPCDREYPVYLGIPDFRAVASYAGGTWDEEKQLLPGMIHKFETSDLRGVLEEMLSGLKNRSENDRQRLRDYFVEGLVSRARHRASVIDLIVNNQGDELDYTNVLEVGCGAGATLFELSKRGPSVGIEPNLLHLIIAKKHAQSLNLPTRFVCGFSEYLPFKNDAFSFVHFMHTLEHFTDQPKGLAEVRRSLAPGGITCFDIPNRFSLWREPHTNIWGIGYLPRNWTALKEIRNLSIWELKRLVRNVFGEQNFSIQTMLVRFQVPGYERGLIIRGIAKVLLITESIPGIRNVIRFFQPGFEVIAFKPEVVQDKVPLSSGDK